VIIGYNAFA